MPTHSRPAHLTSVLFACLLLWSPGARAQGVAPSASAIPGLGIPNLPSIAPTSAPDSAATTLPAESFLSRTAIHGRSPNVWRDLFGDTARDVRNLPSRQTLGWLAIGSAAAIGAKPADSRFGRRHTAKRAARTGCVHRFHAVSTGAERGDLRVRTHVRFPADDRCRRRPLSFPVDVPGADDGRQAGGASPQA